MSSSPISSSPAAAALLPHQEPAQRPAENRASAGAAIEAAVVAMVSLVRSQVSLPNLGPAPGSAMADEASAPQGTRSNVLSGANAHIHARPDQAADPGQMLQYMVRVSPRFDIDPEADARHQRPSEGLVAQTSARNAHPESATQPSVCSTGSAQDEDDAQAPPRFGAEEAPARQASRKQDAGAEGGQGEPPEGEVLYRQLVAALRHEALQSKAAANALNELRRLRRVVLVSPAKPCGEGPSVAHVDVLRPARAQGGTAMRLAGLVTWALPAGEPDWTLLHLFKTQVHGSALQLQPVGEELGNQRVVVSVGVQGGLQASWTQALIQIHDGPRLWRALGRQWSVRLGLGRKSISLCAAKHSEDTGGQHAS